MKSKIKDITVLIVITFVLTLSSTIYMNFYTYIDNTNYKSSRNTDEDISKLSESSKSLIYHEDFNDTSSKWDLYDVQEKTMALSYIPSDDAYTSSANPDINYGSQSQCKVANEPEWIFTDKSWMIGDQWTFPIDIFWDGSNWWLLDTNYLIVKKYSSFWYLAGEYHDLSSQDDAPVDIFWDGSNWWLLSFDNIVYKYDASWGYTGISYDLSSEEDNSQTFFWDGNNWWTAGGENQRIYKYDSSWSYTGISYDISILGIVPRDIFWWEGGYWWVLDSSSPDIYMFEYDWVYTGISHDLSAQDNHPNSIFWDGTNWWMVSDDMVYNYDYTPWDNHEWIYTGISYDFYPIFSNPIDIFWGYGDWWILGYDYQNDDWNAYKYSPSWEFTGEKTILSTIVEEPIDFFFHESAEIYVIGYNYSTMPIVARFSSDWDYFGPPLIELNEDNFPRSISWDGYFWWMLGSENDMVYQYEEVSNNWVYTGVAYYIGSQNTNPRDIFWDGFNWWMLGGNGLIYKYTSSWEYTGISFSLGDQDNDPISICRDDWYNYWWMLGDEQGKVFSYLKPREEEYSFIKKEFPYLYMGYTGYSSLRCYVNDGTFPSTVYSYSTSNFNEASITWDNQPLEVDLIGGLEVTGTGWATIYINRPSYYYLLKCESNSIEFSSSEASSNQPIITHSLSKHYQGGGILYCQTNETELLTLRSPNNINLNLKKGDSIEITFNTTSSNRIDFGMYHGVNIKNYIISEMGNMDFSTRTVELILDEDITIDQFEIIGEFDETKNLIIDDIKIYTPSIYIVTPENKTYTEPMDGYYPATYSFDESAIGEDPINWIVDETGGTCNVMEEIAGHKSVIELNDTSDPAQVRLSNYFNPQVSGILEFWWMTNNVTKNSYFRLNQDNTIGVNLRISDGYFGYYDSSLHQVKIIENNKWYHHQVIFSASTNKYDWYIDGILEVNDANFDNPINLPNRLLFESHTTMNDYCTYYDAIGYSWDPRYNIGDNLIEGLLLNFKNLTALDWMGYSLDGQANKTILGNVTIPLPPDGIHSLQVFGNDSIGNIHESILTYFTVDINPPKIFINLPYDNALFSNIPPNFDLSIGGLYINTTWYTLDNGITNITFKGLAGPINQTEWSKRPDGPVTIKFYANNTYGKVNSSEVIVNKDTTIPIVTIISPEIDEFYGSAPPTFNLSITELNLNKTWYTLDNGITNITFNGLTGTISQEEWEGKVDGPVTIKFYANDSLGFKGCAERIIYKDTTKPTSLISFIPHSETINVNKSTLFTIEADDGFGSGISLIRYKINDSAWIDYSDPFDLSSYEPDYYLITYYSIDVVGNIEAENTILVKLVGQPSKGAPEGIPGYNFYILISVFVVSIILFMKRYKNLK